MLSKQFVRISIICLRLNGMLSNKVRSLLLQ